MEPSATATMESTAATVESTATKAAMEAAAVEAFTHHPKVGPTTEAAEVRVTQGRALCSTRTHRPAVETMDSIARAAMSRIIGPRRAIVIAERGVGAVVNRAVVIEPER